ncbi:MAG: FAD-dependent oxidoreductase, partial [Methyloligellaceae bacterium]
MTATLPDRADVVVIGGGVIGSSVAYHLGLLGAGDVVLLERKKLTCGTTWHSAAQVRQLRSSRSLTEIIRYSAELYGSLEAETGQATGWTPSGSLSIADNPDRLVHIRRQAGMARCYDIDVHEVGPDEIKKLWPLLDTTDILGGIYCPSDGRANPSDLCAALIKGARSRGVQVVEDCSVTGFDIADGRVRGVQTPTGTIECGAVALCAGLWSRDLAALAGLEVPVYACEHFYLLTKPIDGIEGHLPTLGDHDKHLYIRDEVGGLLVGCFEPEGKPIGTDALPKDFEFDLLDEDWDHFEPMMMNAMERIPALEQAEARMLLNGPESFTPDGHPIVGEAAGLGGFYLACGLNSAGVACGGGVGKALAEWIIEGAPTMDLLEVDASRFHSCENALPGLGDRVAEVLGLHYAIAYPGLEHASARNLRTTPLYDQLAAAGARFGQRFGAERALYFDPKGTPDGPLTFGRPPWFDAVAAECAAARNAVALFDESLFGKVLVEGADSQAVLQRVCSNDMSRPAGRVVYTAMLNERGGIESDLTALRLTETSFLL